jgi:hypothetical protein
MPPMARRGNSWRGYARRVEAWSAKAIRVTQKIELPTFF